MKFYNVKIDFYIELKPESTPKWIALTEVLLEIQNDYKKKNNSEKILILVHDRNICYQLRNYLTMGANEYLLYEAMKKLSHKEMQNIRYIKNKIFYSKEINTNIWKNILILIIIFILKKVKQV